MASLETVDSTSWLAGHRGRLQVNDDFRSLDDAQEQAQFTTTMPASGDVQGAICESHLMVQGMHCAACADAVEAALLKQPGVLSAQVNAATRRVTVRWDKAHTLASSWAQAAAHIGYRLLPVEAALGQVESLKEQRKALWRLFVAGFCAMQVMMYSWPIYVADPGTMDADIEALLRWASWWLSLPVVLFASTPFFSAALRDLKQGRIGMDFPVSLAIVVTFWASTAATYAPSGPWGGEIWFDSLTMLVFFLLGGRYLEAKARAKTAGALDALMTRLPESCERQTEQGGWQRVSARRLVVGDVVRVETGQAFPGDGELLSDTATVDEALLTGEAMPVNKARGDQVIAGSRNLQSPVTIQVSAVGHTTRFAQIVALMERAASEKPRLAAMADRMAGPFLLGVILLAAATGLYWWGTDPSKALSTAVAILIVTCPCALSLATPAAMLAATGTLARQGILVQHVQTLEALTQVDLAVFDKTGTLTSDVLAIASVACREGVDRDSAISVAAHLAAGSAHPLSRALVRAASVKDAPAPAAWQAWEEIAGRGIQAEDAQGMVWRLGAPEWCGVDQAPSNVDQIQVSMADGNGWVASFWFEETLREGAKPLVDAFQAAGIGVQVVSGDVSGAVQRVAASLGVSQAISGATPESKAAWIKARQDKGHRVLMVGDGLNDAPVLSQADVSIAMGTGAALAQSQADVIVQNAQLSEIEALRKMSHTTLKVVRQNLGWALAYNASAVPLAALGWMPPWVAGIGMASSSLLVVVNALRLRRMR